MDITHPEIQAYAEKYTSPSDRLLEEIAAFTMQQHPESHMLSGHLQGKLLEMVSWMIRPRRILEIGTFTGFSALSLASGLTEDGELHTIELREPDATTAQGFFDRSPKGKQIKLHVGQALDIIPKLDETWDLVFIDADKPAYIEYFKLVLPKLRRNGFILADNVFFHGQVLDPATKNKSAKGIQAFNEFVGNNEEIDKMMITLRDGLYLIRKL